MHYVFLTKNIRLSHVLLFDRRFDVDELCSNIINDFFSLISNQIGTFLFLSC